MPAEIYKGHFRNFVADRATLPPLSYQEMLRENVCIAPKPLRAFLGEAKNFLMDADGPNLPNRRMSVPSWFDYWDEVLSRDIYLGQTDVLKCGLSNTPVEFEELPIRLKNSMGLSGMINMAGGEGHEGHVHVANHMRSCQVVTVWGFESDEYNRQNKKRGGTYLPPEVRLSMWTIWGINYVTVLPIRPIDTEINAHYDGLFVRSGADIYFVTADDPELENKSKRGRQVPWRIIPAYRPPSTSERILQAIRSTTPMVKRLCDESDESSDTFFPDDDILSISVGFDKSIFEE